LEYGEILCCRRRDQTRPPLPATFRGRERVPDPNLFPQARGFRGALTHQRSTQFSGEVSSELFGIVRLLRNCAPCTVDKHRMRKVNLIRKRARECIHRGWSLSEFPFSHATMPTPSNLPSGENEAVVFVCNDLVESPAIAGRSAVVDHVTLDVVTVHVRVVTSEPTLRVS